MKRCYAITLMIVATGLLFFSCASKSKTTEGLELEFADAQVQAKVEELKEKIDDNPKSMLYPRQLATLLHENGRSLEALEVLDRSFSIDPTNVESKYLYADIAKSLGDYVKAYGAYKDVLQSSEGNNYLDRIAPEFVDAFQVTALVSTEANEAYARFSDDGSKIIYQSDQNGNWDIFEYDMEEQTSRAITHSPHHEENPDYDPQTKSVLYTSTVDDHRDVPYNQKRREIYYHELDNGSERNLTTNGSNDWYPSFSDNGRFIAFVSERNDLREVEYYKLNGSIFIMERDGRFQLELTSADHNDGHPCIEPESTEQDGTIYFDSDRNGSHDIYKMDFKGEQLQRITFNPDWNDVAPYINNNRDKIVFFSDRDGNYELYLMNADGSSQQRLTSHTANDLNPVFSPDGTNVLFYSNRNGNYDLYLMDLTTQNEAFDRFDIIARIDQSLQEMQNE